MSVEDAMTYDEFLTRVIDDGIAAARADYVDPRHAKYLEGSLEGFALCRGQSPHALQRLLVRVNREAAEKRRDAAEDLWFWRCRADEVGWVCNVVSALLINEGQTPLTAYLPTARGVLKAAEIVGVAA
jgi:hypothetical protein